VFKSADPDYFIAHVDVTRVAEYRETAARLAGEPSRGHLSAKRLITIAQIENRRAARAANWRWPATCASPRSVD
jgi:hypothetical protein